MKPEEMRCPAPADARASKRKQHKQESCHGSVSFSIRSVEVTSRRLISLKKRNCASKKSPRNGSEPDADKEKKLVVWFTNDERGLVLNRVNNRTIRGAFGDPIEGWKGKIIIVFPTMAEFRGKMGPAMRVRIPPPKQATGNGQGQAAAKPAPAEPPPPPPATTVCCRRFGR